MGKTGLRLKKAGGNSRLDENRWNIHIVSGEDWAC